MRFFLSLLFICLFTINAEEVDYTIEPAFPVEGARFELVFKSHSSIQIKDVPAVKGLKFVGRSSLSYGAYKHGSYTFPSFTVHLDGKAYKTKPKTIKVWPENISCPDDKVIITKVFYNGQNSLPEKVYPGIFFKVNYEVNTLLNWNNDSERLKTFPECNAENLNLEKYTSNSVFSNRVIDYRNAVSYKLIDGRPYRTSTYSYSMAPLKSGSYDFDLSHKLSASSVQRGRLSGRRLEGNFKLNKTITVSQLPTARTGVESLEIAGKWRVWSEVSKKKVQTGHTFELRILVQGSGGDVARIKAPELTFPGIEVDPPEIVDIEKGKMISYGMRALRPNAKLRDITLATFDYEQGKFIEHVLKPQITFTGKALNDINTVESVNLNVTDIPVNMSDSLKLGASSISRPLYFNISPLWYFIAFFLPLIFLVFYYFQNRDKKEVNLRKEARRRLKLLCQELAAGSDNEIIGKELISCLAQYYSLPPGITADELAGQLEDKELAELILQNSHSHFLPGNQKEFNSVKLVSRLKHLLIVTFLFVLPIRAENFETAAVESFRNNDYVTAERLFLKSIEQDNANPNIFYNLGLSRLAQDKFPEALASFETAAHLVPSDEDSRQKISEIRSQLKLSASQDAGFFSFVDQLRPDHWLQASLFCWSVFWLIIIGQFIFKVPGKRWTALLGLVLTILCVIPFLMQKESSYKKGQYIVLQESQTYTAADITEKTSIQLKAGQSVQVMTVDGESVQVEVNGLKVWLPIRSLILFW